MGLKSLSSLHSIPILFFHKRRSSREQKNDEKKRRGGPRAARVIWTDGRVRAYERAVPASELMREHPCHLVCRSDAFVIGEKIPSLSPADQLQPGHSYLLLPAHLFHSVLSFLSLISTLTQGNTENSPLRYFNVEKTKKGALKMRVSEELIEKLEERSRGVCTTEELEKEYRKLVMCSSKRWKPKLAPLKESEGSRGFWALRTQKPTNLCKTLREDEPIFIPVQGCSM